MLHLVCFLLGERDETAHTSQSDSVTGRAYREGLWLVFVCTQAEGRNVFSADARLQYRLVLLMFVGDPDRA